MRVLVQGMAMAMALGGGKASRLRWCSRTRDYVLRWTPGWYVWCFERNLAVVPFIQLELPSPHALTLHGLPFCLVGMSGLLVA